MSAGLLLETHPYCGFFMDELVWMIYRAKDGPKQEWADQTITIDLFLNSTQCSFDPHLWKDEPIKKWFSKRNRFSFSANFSNPESFYTVANMRERCEMLQSRRKAACSKEIRFLGHVGELLQAASDRGIPFSLVYQMRDPRASVLSQVIFNKRSPRSAPSLFLLPQDLKDKFTSVWFLCLWAISCFPVRPPPPSKVIALAGPLWFAAPWPR